jgi:non-haem Fe2+, alpha-ketoglutarate-dependent halogenase
MLTAAEIARYHADGYLAGMPILTPSEIAEYRADCLRCCGTARGDGVHRQASNRVKPYLLFPWAAKLVRHPRILDVVEALIGPDILVFHTTIWLKEAGAGNFVPWHQDATYFGLSPHEHVTAWVALTPSNRENGCVQVLPGSHGSGQRAHRDERDQRAMLSRGQTMTEALDESAAVDLLLEPGEVTFHHTLMVHRSAPNQSRQTRIGFGISYIPARVRHVTGTRLSASLVRGEDRHGHFDLEPEPDGEESPAAARAHRDAMRRFHEASESIPEMARAH